MPDTVSENDGRIVKGADSIPVHITNPGAISGGGSGGTGSTSATSPNSVQLTDGADFYKATTPFDTQPISGTVSLSSDTLAALETTNVNVNNFPATQTVAGTVTANLGTLNGAATSANQTAANSSLSSIDGKVATAANQTTANTSLSSIDTKVATAINQTTANTSLASIDTKVATAANQATSNISLASLVTGTGTPADAEAGDAVGSFSVIALLKRIRTKLTDLTNAVNGPAQTSQRFTATAATATQNFVPTLSGTDFTYTQIIIWLKITTGGGTGVSMRVQGAPIQEPTNFLTLNGTAANVTTAGTYTYGFGFRNTNTLGMSQAVGGVLPKNFRIQVFHNDTTALTYTVDIQYFQ